MLCAHVIQTQLAARGKGSFVGAGDAGQGRPRRAGRLTFARDGGACRRRPIRHGAVAKLAVAETTKSLTGAAFPIGIAAIPPDAGAHLVAMLLAVVAVGGENRISSTCALGARSICAVLSSLTVSTRPVMRSKRKAMTNWSLENLRRITAFKGIGIAALKLRSEAGCVAI